MNDSDTNTRDNDDAGGAVVKPTREWGKGLGAYFGDRRDADIRKARQLSERNCIYQLFRGGYISEREAYAAIYQSTDMAVALSELQAEVAAREAQQQ